MTIVSRTPFTTSRQLEFCTVAELTKLVGAEPADWPRVVLKELVDNSLDACEEAGVAPEIVISVAKDVIAVSDNGPGIAPDTTTRLLDYQTKTSSREAYVAPSRGAQGNALQSLLAMPFVLDGKSGETTITSRGVTHRINFTIDPIRREPKIEHHQRGSLVQSGTRIALQWPVSASSLLAAAKAGIVQIVRDFVWLNPHATIALRWDGKSLFAAKATDPTWRKWRPSDPAPAAWYDDESFARLIAACVADDQDHERDRMVREFVAQFRGCTRSDIQKRLLDAVDAARMPLRELFKYPARVAKLLATMQAETKPVPARDLGLLGRDHFEARFADIGAEAETLQYRRELCDIEGVPYVIEAAFAWCPDNDIREQIVGVNSSPSLINPFRRLGGYGGLDYLLSEQRAGDEQPIVLALHLASPRVAYTDKAKSALVLPNEVDEKLANAVQIVTKNWARIVKAEERDANAEARRRERLIRGCNEKQKDVAFEVMARAYAAASDNGKLTANARQIMYAARPEIQERTGKQIDLQYFTQTLLPDYLAAHAEETADWDVVFDDRGHFTEPHTGHMIGLGTVNVREYVASTHKIQTREAGFAPAQIVTRGPHGCFGALLYIEKEGFAPLLDRVQLDKRFDIGIMSSKGMSVTAARKLADEICHAYRIPLLVLHDFDKSGFSILGTFNRRVARRYTFENAIKVVDLGIRLGDIRGLQTEDVFDKGDEDTRRANLEKNGAKPAEIEFLLGRRVELNAMTSRQFVAFVERKLIANGVRKIVPTNADLIASYQVFARGQQVEKIVSRELAELNGVKVSVPRDLRARVEDYLRHQPAARWDEAVAAIVSNKDST